MSAERDEKSNEGTDPCKLGTELPPGLYLVATPIGNLRDITLRALDTLQGVDLIACEDTRVTGKLLRKYGISVPMRTYHEHNAARSRPALIDRLTAGGRVALVSDAGTPLISDPGYKLVRAALEAGVHVTALPGPSAVLGALQLSGAPSDRFHFAGFLPSKEGAKRRMIESLASIPGSLVLYESAQRLGPTLGLLAEILGSRQAAVARELTKLHEEVRRGPLDELAAAYAGARPPKGEIVVVIGPADETPPDEAEIDAMLRAALRVQPLRAAVDDVARATGAGRRTVYQRALALRDETDG